MGRAHGVKRRKSKSFNYNTNRNRLWKQSKKLPHIQCKAIREAWEGKKGIYQNLEEMGLCADPNKINRIPSAKVQFKENVGKIEDVLDKEPKISKSAKKKQKQLRKGFVVEKLVEEAAKTMESTFHVSNEVASFARHMVGTYGNDYKKMARDPKNYFQLTAKQIKKKIEQFQVSKYLDALRIAKKQDKMAAVTE